MAWAIGRSLLVTDRPSSSDGCCSSPWTPLVRRSRWGLGYATEAASAVLRHGFDHLGLDEVLAEIDAANIASIRVAERIGLRRRASGTSEGRAWLRYNLTRLEAGMA